MEWWMNDKWRQQPIEVGFPNILWEKAPAGFLTTSTSKNEPFTFLFINLYLDIWNLHEHWRNNEYKKFYGAHLPRFCINSRANERVWLFLFNQFVTRVRQEKTELGMIPADVSLGQHIKHTTHWDLFTCLELISFLILFCVY